MSDGEPILSAEADTSFKKLRTVPLFRFVNLTKCMIRHRLIVDNSKERSNVNMQFPFSHTYLQHTLAYLHRNFVYWHRFSGDMEGQRSMQGVFCDGLFTGRLLVDHFCALNCLSLKALHN